MKIFLIHDPLRKDRELLFTKEFTEQGITEWELMPAVKNLAKVTLNIAEAHKNCIRRAQKENLPQCVIMEDDLAFSAPGAYNRFLEFFKELPENWNVFTSGSYDYQAAAATESLFENIIKLQRFSGLHCYAVNSVYYDKFLDVNVTGHFDKLLRGNLYMTYPMLCLQHPGFSNTVNRQVNYNITHAKNIKLWKP